MTTDEPTPASSGKHRAGKAAKPAKPARAPKPAKPAREPKAAKVELEKSTAGSAAATTSRRKKPPRRWVGFAVLSFLALGTIASAVIAAVLYSSTSSHNDAIDQARGVAVASSDAVGVASADAQDILSYDYRSLSSDIDKARSETTGQLRTDYNSSATKLLSQAPSIKAIVKATISGQAVVHSQRDRATVLLYVDQESVKQLAGAKTPTTRIDPLRIQVTMSKVNGRWLASDLESL